MFLNGNFVQFFSFISINVPDREYYYGFILIHDIKLPYGNSKCISMKYTPVQIGQLVKTTRKHMGVTQKILALTSGTGSRFIIDLEKGKPTCQLGKVLMVLQTLGIELNFRPPDVTQKDDAV